LWEKSTGWHTNSENLNDPFTLLLNDRLQQMKNFTQNHYTTYTVNCGEIRPKDEGLRVKIAGKVFIRPHTARFLEIKDKRGIRLSYNN